jgi:O-antigen/teichoic acid export membrane protein
LSNGDVEGVSALRSNTTYSIIAMCLSVLSMMIALRLLLHFSNAELFGLWSLTVGMLAFSRVGDVSGSGSLSRFVARESKFPEHQIAFIDTVLIFTLVFYCVLLLVITAPLSWFLETQIPFELHDTGGNLLFISMLILILNVLGVSQMSAIDGLYESVTRSKIQIFSAFVLCVSSYPLIRYYEVYGYAFSIALQHLLNLIISRVILTKKISGLMFLPVNFSKGKLREITTFGFKVQGQSIAGLFYDPLAKLLVNNYAGLSGVAVYDIAYKLASYCQLVLVAACNPLLPILSGFTQGQREEKKQYFYVFLRKFLTISCGPAIIVSLLVPVASMVFFEEPKSSTASDKSV